MGQIKLKDGTDFFYVDSEVVYILYKNHRREVAWRNIVPWALGSKQVIFHGISPYHSEQWLMNAVDLDKLEERTFAMKDIINWMTFAERKQLSDNSMEKYKDILVNAYHTLI